MNQTPQDDTRRRVLEAAGEAFADRGFDGATVREICREAGANLAAVNYHFGDKGQLYREVVREAHRCGPPWPNDEAFDGDTPAGQLRLYVRHFLEHVLTLERHDSWHNRLMMREMLRPTEAGQTLVVESIQPRYLRLQKILGQICPGADPRRLDALCLSVVGQCLHYKMARPITERLLGRDRFASVCDLDFLADHIAGFTLAALGLAPPLSDPDRSRNGAAPALAPGGTRP